MELMNVILEDAVAAVDSQEFLVQHLKDGGSMALVYDDAAIILEMRDGEFNINVVAGYHRVPKSLGLLEDA